MILLFDLHGLTLSHTDLLGVHIKNTKCYEVLKCLVCESRLDGDKRQPGEQLILSSPIMKIRMKHYGGNVEKAFIKIAKYICLNF